MWLERGWWDNFSPAPTHVLTSTTSSTSHLNCVSLSRSPTPPHGVASSSTHICSDVSQRGRLYDYSMWQYIILHLVIEYIALPCSLANICIAVGPSVLLKNRKWSFLVHFITWKHRWLQYFLHTKSLFYRNMLILRKICCFVSRLQNCMFYRESTASPSSTNLGCWWRQSL